MKKTLLGCLVILMMTGCTVNNRETMVNFESGTSMKVDASGAKNETNTDQKADGDLDLSGLAEAVTKWVESNMAGIVGKLKVSDLVDESKLVDETADQGNVVEVE